MFDGIDVPLRNLRDDRPRQQTACRCRRSV